MRKYVLSSSLTNTDITDNTDDINTLMEIIQQYVGYLKHDETVTLTVHFTNNTDNTDNKEQQ